MKLTYSDFIDLCITEKGLLLQHHLSQETENSDKYYKIFSYDENSYYECLIDTTTSTGQINVTDYETNYVGNSNKPLQPRESETGLVKTKPRPVEGTLKLGFIYFTTGDLDSLDFGDNEGENWEIFTSTGTTQLGASTGITWLIASPAYGYYIDGGGLQLLSTSTGSFLPHVNFILAPNIPSAYGGSWKFVKNKKMLWYQEKFELEVPPKYVKYYPANPYANQVKLEVLHDKDARINFELWIKIYK